MSKKLKQPHELKTEVNIKALIYGQPGLGKTTFALSAPNPVLLDFDGGVHRVKSEHQTTTLQVESWQDVIDVMPELAPFRTIVIDTAGKMLDYLGAFLISKNTKLGKANGALTLQGYGERKAEFSRFIKLLSTMGKHILFIAHEKEEKDGDAKYIRPEVGGSSGTDLYKELDLIGYMEAIGKKRTVSFSPSEKYYAKNACGLSEIIELSDLKEGSPNVAFDDLVLKVYEKSLADRAEIVQEFNALTTYIEEKIESVTNANEANEVLSWIETTDSHIWTSKLQAKKALVEKMKSIDLVFDKVKNEIVLNKKTTNEPAKV